MARLFDDAAPQYISASSAVLSGVPITMACWFNSDDAAAVQTLISLTDIEANTERFYLVLEGDVVGDPVGASVESTAASERVITSTGYSVNTWHHACGVWAAINDRSAFIDGGSKGTGIVSVTPTGLNTFTIGVSRFSAGTFDPMSGRIAEAAIWNIALFDAEVAVLAAGYSPLLVRPQNLVFYAPLIRTIQDVVGAVTLTNNGSTVGDHCRILNPAPIPMIWSPGVSIGLLGDHKGSFRGVSRGVLRGVA